MNIVILTAAGKSTRMGQDIPKQFLNVENKPVIIHTMEAFQKHPNIDAIIVVCLDGWHDILRAYAKQFGIDKLVAVVNGGENGQESIRKGLEKAKELYSDDDIVLIHDGNRPLVSQNIISDCIVTCQKYGNAITTIPCQEVMALIDDDNISSIKQIPRAELKRTQTPHAFKLGEIISAHNEASKKNITNTVASCDLYIALGKRIYFSVGSEKNIKLTTPEDIEIFKALLHTKKDDWMK